MKFNIYITHDRKLKRLNVEKTFSSNTLENFHIKASNISFTIQGNKPLLNSRGLKRKKIHWKVIQGGYDNYSILEKIISAIEKTLQYNKRN